jgi:hypothetical protein
MGAVAILRELWRHRIVVLSAIPLALIVGLSVPYKLGIPLQSRQHEVGVASATALLDTPRSQVVALGGPDAAVAAALPARAVLLASLLTTSPLHERIARRAGVASNLLIATAPPQADGAADVRAPAATGASVADDDPRASLVTLSTSMTLPMIVVDARAPDEATAERLANAAVTTLAEYVKDTVGAEAVPSERRIVVEQLGPARSTTKHEGPSGVLGVLAGLLVLLAVCAAILLVSVLARDWRRMSAVERRGAPPAGGGPGPEGLQVLDGDAGGPRDSVVSVGAPGPAPRRAPAG